MNFLTNWKTSVAGIITILVGVAGLFGVKGGAVDPTTSGGLIATGIGLLVASDAPKS